MNVQITVPYQTCPKKCPFCIANNPKTLGKYKDNTGWVDYWVDIDMQLKALYEENGKKPLTVVLTGDTEPTLNMGWVDTAITQLKRNINVGSIEIQTACHEYETLNKLLTMIGDRGVVAISVFTVNQMRNLKKVFDDTEFSLNIKSTKRLTLILNDMLNLKTLSENAFDLFTFYKQVTFKVLQKGLNGGVNEWIDKHKAYDADLLDVLVTHLQALGKSVVIDENCMDTLGGDRYQIIREDGKLYRDWNDLKGV